MTLLLKGRGAHNMADEFYVKFWGVRGSIPCPGLDYVHFGGNTPCVEIRCGSHVFILDAGSGIRLLGESLKEEGIADFDLMLSHSHYDHICGLPFFSPLFNTGTTMRMWIGHFEDDMTGREMLEGFMKAPFFPVPPSIFNADVEIHDFRAGENLELRENVVIRTARLNHPGGCVGYRFEYDGKAICYITDTEHRPDQPDDQILPFVNGADIVIYDAMFTEDEYTQCQGYGHSTWGAGAKLCAAAGVKQYVLFHHSPTHDDVFLKALDQEVQSLRPGSVIAREGLILSP
jgi:phosphoribosyl 1,2-cyclic phosphodiesterase